MFGMLGKVISSEEVSIPYDYCQFILSRNLHGEVVVIGLILGSSKRQRKLARVECEFTPGSPSLARRAHSPNGRCKP